jgi:hypothetical protein
MSREKSHLALRLQGWRKGDYHHDKKMISPEQKNRLFSPELIQERAADAEEQECTNNPDGPRDRMVAVHIHSHKKDTEHRHDRNAVPPFLLAFPVCRISHHAHSTGIEVVPVR